MKIELKNGFICLVGFIDEFAEYDELLKMPRPLKINMRGIQSVNSQGFKMWVTFVAQLAEHHLELYECPLAFIDLVNFVPTAASKSGKPDPIKSVMVPYSCLSCSMPGALALEVSRIKIDGAEVSVPALACPSCKNPVIMEVDPDDYFVFLCD